MTGRSSARRRSQPVHDVPPVPLQSADQARPHLDRQPTCVDCRRHPAVVDDRCGACWVSASLAGTVSDGAPHGLVPHQSGRHPRARH